MVELDSRFPSQWPFGILKTAQWIFSFVVLICLWCSSFTWAGTGLVYFTAWTSFLMGLFSWLAHLFGLQRKTLQVGGAFFFIPFALIDFVYSVVLFALYALSTLLCVYFMFKGFGYAANISLSYAFAAIFCVLSGGTCGFLALLLFRASENKPINLRSIFVEGTTTAQFDPAAGTTTTTGVQRPVA
uniref:MARVEL domain-containing protein n=1 Tax=Plectus sambesii TaxID=2011161 RepID=A0A914WKH8_9BILA